MKRKIIRIEIIDDDTEASRSIEIEDDSDMISSALMIEMFYRGLFVLGFDDVMKIEGYKDFIDEEVKH